MSNEVISEFRAEPGEKGGLAAVVELVAGGHLTMRVLVGSEELELPPSLARLLVVGAGALGDGESVALVSEEAEVSPAEAAKLLGVSRQYVDRLVANGVLPARQIPHSRYRKIPARAVLAHRVTKDAKRAGIASIRCGSGWRSLLTMPSQLPRVLPDTNVCYPMSLLDLVLRL